MGVDTYYLQTCALDVLREVPTHGFGTAGVAPCFC
jgi:hypothetical protein